MSFDDNIVLAGDGVSTVCIHCAEVQGDASTDPLKYALRTERKSTDLGPDVRADPRMFTDKEIVLRQLFCPKCLTVLATEVVPQDEGSFKS